MPLAGDTARAHHRRVVRVTHDVVGERVVEAIPGRHGPDAGRRAGRATGGVSKC